MASFSSSTLLLTIFVFGLIFASFALADDEDDESDDQNLLPAMSSPSLRSYDELGNVVRKASDDDDDNEDDDVDNGNDEDDDVDDGGYYDYIYDGDGDGDDDDYGIGLAPAPASIGSVARTITKLPLTGGSGTAKIGSRKIKG